jgi:hypothetical protein
MLLVKTDPRVTIEISEDMLHASFSIKKCKTSDEARYLCKVEDEEGKKLDFAGFSVFVKGDINVFCLFLPVLSCKI